MTLTQLKYVITIADTHSMNEAARTLFISQPSLSQAVRELEEEIGIILFNRSNRGVKVTPEGEEFLGYARQVTEQCRLLEDRYIEKKNSKKRFSVSMQHYTFAVKAFVEMVKQFGMDEYEFAVHETKTYEVIENVKNFRSEIGILYLNDFNRAVLTKLFQESELEFHAIIDCGIYVYMWKGHPLAGKEEIALEELDDYPCLSFDQGINNSFYFAEEVLSTYAYKRLIKANDRATLLNLMVGLNGYTLCSGIICESLNGSDYCAVKLKSEETMTIGYLKRKGVALSPLGQKYLEEIRKMPSAEG
ncbi:hydrogen peroxide-inducible genes activator [Lachnospiraceae bacterium]|jgi:Transcriptional regulator|nr:hydrogen peroxide-inducible genes activator [Lachnospiraceae bacterium]GFI70191.1 hydrogen peroxide-inducible genes activator [Lachnospiraceae bacterium]